MQPAHTTLFAADFSEDSVEAFGVTCSITVGLATRLIVLHVIDPDRDEAGTTPGAEALRAALKRRLRGVYLPDRPFDVEYRLCPGSAPDGILRTASEVDADLIAMGTHGRTGLRRLIAGSVATHVLREAPCSVLALRGHDGAPGTREVRVILNPIDFSKASEAASDAVRELARDVGARLIVMHVTPLELHLDGGSAGEIDSRDDQRSLDAICERLDGPDLKYPVEMWFGRGRVAHEILRTAKRVACDLIVMGTHGRTGLGRLLLGNVAESVIPRADCGVLIVKAPDMRRRPATRRSWSRRRRSGDLRRVPNVPSASSEKELLTGECAAPIVITMARS